MSAPTPPNAPIAVPPVPDRTDKSTFVTKSFNFTSWFAPFQAWLVTVLTYIVDSIAFVESQSDAAQQSALDAQSYSGVAAAVANFKGDWADQTGAAAIPYSVWDAGNVYALLSNLADVTSSRPSLSPSDWANITAAMSGYTNPMTTANDLIVGGVAGAQTRFGVPTSSGMKYLLSYDVDTSTMAWDDADTYLGGGGSGGNGELDWYDAGNVATTGSQTVTVDFTNGRFYVMSMQGADTTGTLTLQLTNLPATTNKTATMLIFIRRGGRKPVSITASGFTINYAQGTAGNLNGTTGYYDVYEVLKKFGSTQLDVTHVRTGIF